MRYKYISFFLLFLISDLLSAQSITSSTQMPWFNHVSTLDELVGLRSRNTKHFINGENKQKAFVSISSIHYKENEEWKEIKYEIVPSIEKPNYYQNTTNNFHTFYPKELGALPLITTIENYSVSEQFIGISFLDKNYKSISENHTSFNKVSIEGNKAKYQSNISSLVYEYSQLSDGRKSDLVLQDVQFLKNAPQATKYIAIKEIIEVPEGWKVLKGENGIDFYDEKNTWRVNYETPVAYEEKIDKEDDLNKGEIYFNILSNNKVEIVSLFNYKWLIQSNREYPLHLDPIVTYNPFLVTYSTGYMTGPSAGKASGIMRLAGVGHISWAKFNIGALASTGITSVIDAKYHGFHYTTSGSPNKIATIKGLANVDPTIAANTAISTRASIAPSYNPTYVYGTNVINQWRVGTLSSIAYPDIMSSITQGWFALAFVEVSGSTIFMYHRSYNDINITQRSFLEIDYSTSPILGNPYMFPPIGNFAYDKGIDTVWVNSPFAFVNNSIGDSANYWRVEGQPGATNCVPTFGCYHQVGTQRNFRYSFTDTGSYLVTLVVRNRTGRDSVSKWVYVGYPSSKPIANFFMDKQIIGLSEQIPCYDLSENGPTSWEWYLNPYCIGCSIDPNAYANDFLPSSGAQLPVLRARDPGKFEVCLKVTNNVGSDSICKKDYINVIGGLSMCASAADTVGTTQTGYVYDNGGPNQNYFPSIMGNCYYTIDPCASSVTAYLERFRLRNQDSIVFRNGGPNGPKLATLGGANIPDSMKVLTANTGRLYMEWKLGAPQNTMVGDSGFVIRWESTPATYGAPYALFTSPDTVYSNQKVIYTNATIGQGNLSYTWDVNGDGIYNDFNTANGAHFTFVTLAPLLRDVCLRVSNCKGSNTYCKKLIVLPIHARPIANFMSPRPAGFTTDTFDLKDLSKNGPNQWEWIITPKNEVYVAGTDSSFQNTRFMLGLPGKYTVRLKARNALGIDSVEKQMYLDVLSYNAPFTDYPIADASDIGISRVQLEDIDTITPLKNPTYDPLYYLQRAVLYRGVNYTLKIMRETGVTPMERKAWIDFNFDADFIDAGETLLSEHNGTNPTAEVKFKIPDHLTPGRVTRLRIGVSEGGTVLTPDKSRSGCFEDYGIEIGNDLVAPTIALKGAQIHRVQRNTVYVDPGVIATDNLEGDISDRFEMTSNIDMTQLGVYTAKYWVKDLYGNVSDTITRTIQVEINQVGPTVTIVGADTVRMEVRSSYTELGATAIDNEGQNITNRIATIGQVDTAQIGTYYINYSARDAFGFTGEKTRVVIVQKTSKPWIKALQDSIAADQGIAKHQIFTAYNNGDGIAAQDAYFSSDRLTLTRTGSVDEKIPGSYVVQYTACDPIGNCSAPYYLQVDVQDTVPPVVSLLGSNPMEVNVYDDNFNDPGISAVDNYYSSNALIYVTQRNVNTNQLGTYNITYTVKDGSGNKTTLERIVKVVDKIAPTIEILGSNPYELFWMDTFDISEDVRILDNYYSNEELLPLLEKTTTLAIDQNTGKYYANERGWKEITYKVTDPSGNVSKKVKRIVSVDFRSGIIEVSNANELTIYPNPSNGKFTIQSKEVLNGATEISLYNILGAKVYSTSTEIKGTSIDINTQGLKAGIYLVQINNNGTIHTERITIK